MSTVAIAGQTFTFGVSVPSQADDDIFQAAATIAAGDFQRSINGAAFANLDNLPTVTPAAGKRIQIVLSAAETTAAGAGGEIYIVASDQADDEWKDLAVGVKVFATDLLALVCIDGVLSSIPAVQRSNVTVIKGDSYLDVDGRRLKWSSTAWNIAATSTIVVIVQDIENFAGTRVNATTIGLEMTSAQTAALTEGENFLYSVQEIKLGGERITRVQGEWRTTIRPIPLT